MSLISGKTFGQDDAEQEALRSLQEAVRDAGEAETRIRVRLLSHANSFLFLLGYCLHGCNRIRLNWDMS